MNTNLTIILLLAITVIKSASAQTMDPGLFDSEGSGEGSSSGSGEGSGGGSGDPECVRPQYRPPPPSDDENGIITEIRCHLACMDWVTRTDNITLMVNHSYPLWPTISVESIEKDCRVYQKIQECRTGCVIHGRFPRATISRCKSLCSRQCLTTCDEALSCEQAGTECLRSCSQEDCQEGCTLYEQEIDIQDPSGDMLPLAPFRAPSLVVPDLPVPQPSVYYVNVSNDTQAVTSGQNGVPMATSFIFRVLHYELNIFAYYWQFTLNDLLDLISFACEEDVLVQYAAVNKYGRSRWSHHTSVDVYGVLIPESPLPENPDPFSITFTISPDLRPTFWKHAIINVTWLEPADVQSLSHYVVRLHPHNVLCGNRGKEIIVPRPRTSAVIEADTPLDGPVGGCTYDISVSSQAVSGDYVSPGNERVVIVEQQHTVPVPLNFQCERSWDELDGTFQFTVSWSVPESVYLQQAIRHFHMNVRMVSVESDSIEAVNEVQYDIEQPEYSYQTDKLDFGPAGSYYRIGMEITTRYSNEIVIPRDQVCEFDAMPLPSAVINEITIDTTSITVTNFTETELGGGLSEVMVDVEWRLPGGNINSFDLRVTERAGYDEESDVGEDFFLQRIETVSAHVNMLLTIELPDYVENSCVYFQVRSINVHGAVSNWSTPACISVGELHLTTSTVTVSTTEAPVTALSVEVLYSIIALVVVMLVAVVIMALCVLLACVKNRRASKRASIFTGTEHGSFHRKNSLDVMPTKGHFQGGNAFPLVPLTKMTKNWELHPRQVVIETKLGHGAFGDVFQGTIKGGVGSDETDGPQLSTVAIKILKSSSDDMEKQSFLDHIEQTKLVTDQSMSAGEPGNHIIKMIGCVTTQEPFSLVSEIPSQGDLLSYLHDQRAMIVDGYRGVEVTTRGLLQFAEQIATGMKFLSHIGVVHGDLACRNMYLDPNMVVKISDYGLSGSSKQKAKPRAYHRTIDGRLPMRWMAIESLEEGQFSTASDVWGFGVTLWEIITLGGFPYSTVSHKELVSYLETGQRLDKPTNCSQQLYNIITPCWNEESHERPSFTHLKDSLHGIQSKNNLLSLNIDSTLPYYNVVLSNSLTSTPEHVSNGVSSRSGEGSSGNYWQRKDKVGDKSYQLSDHVLPSIVEEEDLDQLLTIDQFLGTKSRTTHNKPTIHVVVETYDNSENDSTGSGDECALVGNVPHEADRSDSDCTETLTLTSPSPVSDQSTDVSEIIDSPSLEEIKKQDLTNPTETNSSHSPPRDVPVDLSGSHDCHMTNKEMLKEEEFYGSSTEL